MAGNCDQICKEYIIISGRNSYQVYFSLGLNLVTTLSSFNTSFSAQEKGGAVYARDTLRESVALHKAVPPWLVNGLYLFFSSVR